MAALPALLLAAAGVHGLELAPGQQAMVRSHETEFPKAAWVAAERVPVSGSPSLGGRLLAVLERGEKLEIAGFAGLVPRPGSPGAVDDILAIGVGSFGYRGAGYLRAADVAVVEVSLGQCCDGTLVFGSVTGRSPSPAGGGLVLDLAVWARPGDGAPELVLSVPNLAPGPRLLPVEGGAAVEAAGRVAILDRSGRVTFRTPAAEAWTLLGAGARGFRLEGPGGVRTLDTRGLPVD